MPLPPKTKRRPNRRSREPKPTDDVSDAEALEKANSRRWEEEAAAEMAEMEQLMIGDPGWIHFNMSSSPWLPFTIDPTIDEAMYDKHFSLMSKGLKDLGKWMHNAESSVNFWIVNKILEKEGRAERFRALGRGWIIVALRRRERKFKWWFESTRRILRNHQMDMRDLQLTPELVEKYTVGYMPQCELVIMMKGMTPSEKRPLISIQKMASNYVLLHRWATTEESKKAVMTPFPTDEDRQVYAARTLKRQEKRAKDRQRKVEQQLRETELEAQRQAEVTSREDMGKAGFFARQTPLEDTMANLQFERLLSEMKGEMHDSKAERIEGESIASGMAPEITEIVSQDGIVEIKEGDCSECCVPEDRTGEVHEAQQDRAALVQQKELLRKELQEIDERRRHLLEKISLQEAEINLPVTAKGDIGHSGSSDCSASSS